MKFKILKRFSKQDPVMPDTVLVKWAWENIYSKMVQTPYRTPEQVCLWMIQRIKNKGAVKWVQGIMRMQEQRDRCPKHMSNPEPLMKQLDGMIQAQTYGVCVLMSENGKNGDAMIGYLLGRPAHP